MKRIASIWFVLALAFSGCHADPDDPGGQADELSDPVRRQNALANLQRLYSTALADNDGDRSAAAVQEVADAIADKLNQAYIDSPTDNQNRLSMLEIMSEMRDPRTLPALIEALNWRAGVNEEHAIRAGQTLSKMDIPEGKKAEVVTAVGEAVRKITQARPIDNRLRVEFLRTLGSIDHPSVQPILIEIATRQDEAQNFLINRLAAQQLGNVADEAAIQPMIQALFLFAPNNPAMRMNDVAAEVLVRIGQPALQPLLALLRGENAEANAVVQSYIDAVRERDAGAADQMSVRQVTGSEATFTLGALGFTEAFEPLLAETQSEDMFRRVNGAVAIVRLNHTASTLTRVREVLTRVYGSMEPGTQGTQARAQLIAAMRSLYDPGYIPFFSEQANMADNHPVVRLEAVNAVGLVANKAEAQRLQQWLATLDRPGDDNDDPYLQQFQQQTEKSIEVAIECDVDVACYIGKLGDSDTAVARKAAFMLGRLGQGNEAAVTALVDKLGHPDIEVRLSVVAALDCAASSGSQAAVDRISELQQEEEGRSVWTNFARQALPIQARLRARTDG